MRESLKQKLIEFVYKQDDWVSSSAIEDYARDIGYLGSNAKRTMRKLRENGDVEQRINSFRTAEYRRPRSNEVVTQRPPKLEFGHKVYEPYDQKQARLKREKKERDQEKVRVAQVVAHSQVSMFS